MVGGVEATLTGGMQVMSDDEYYIGSGRSTNKLKHNNDLIMGQHQVVHINGPKATTTTIFENMSNNQGVYDHEVSATTINDRPL